MLAQALTEREAPKGHSSRTIKTQLWKPIKVQKDIFTRSNPSKTNQRQNPKHPKPASTKATGNLTPEIEFGVQCLNRQEVQSTPKEGR